MGKIITKSKEEITKRQQKAIEFSKKNKKIKAKEYAKINKISVPTSVKDLKDLVKKGYIDKVGSYRGAYYIIKEDK